MKEQNLSNGKKKRKAKKNRSLSHINSLMRRKSGLNALVWFTMCFTTLVALGRSSLNGCCIERALNLINFYRKTKKTNLLSCHSHFRKRKTKLKDHLTSDLIKVWKNILPKSFLLPELSFCGLIYLSGFHVRAKWSQIGFTWTSRHDMTLELCDCSSYANLALFREKKNRGKFIADKTKTVSGSGRKKGENRIIHEIQFLNDWKKR